MVCRLHHRAAWQRRRHDSYVNGSTTTEEKMTDQNLKHNANLTTNEQSKEATADKALFVSEWRINAGKTLYFPIQGREGEIVIDWGDGSSDAINTGDNAYISHTYSESGVYPIKVDGTITRWRHFFRAKDDYDNDDDKNPPPSNGHELVRILSYGKTSFGPHAFADARKLVSLPEGESPRFFENNARGTFKGASSFNQSINHWDTSQITDMSEMFYDAESFDQPLDKWDVSNVTDMSNMFWGARSFDQPLNDWDVSNVYYMDGIFCGTKRFNQPLNNWDVSNVTHMVKMFEDAESFDQPLNNWDVSNVTHMGNMFWGARSFNQPLNDWDVSNVTDMVAMFADAKSFNQPLNDWDVSNVTDMSYMFSGAKSFNQPINDWDVSNVTDMSMMFSGAESFNQPLDKWDISNKCDMKRIFSGSGLDEDNYSILLNGPYSKRWAKWLNEDE